MRAEISVLILFLLCGHTMSDHCKQNLSELATKQKFFVYCATTHSVPVEICIQCEPQYDNMTKAYDWILKNCFNIYIDNDRLNVVSSTQSILVGLWIKAFCDDCFANDNFNIFNDKYRAFNICQTMQENVCTECLDAYQDLNSFYINLDQHNNAKVCYDMQDKMNRTRSLWSNTNGCCHRSFDITLFVFASSFCAVLPLLFYISMFLYGKRRERNHGVVDADTENNTPLVPEEIAPSEQDPIVLAAQTPVPIPAESMNIESDSGDDSDYGVKKNKKL